MKVLLLNNTFHPIAFITDRKAIRLILKEKVDVLSVWPGVRYFYANGFIDLPSVLRLKYPIARTYNRVVFSRNSIFRRDNYSCLYCGKSLTPYQITLDHIVPKSKGGSNSYENCVSSCIDCNREKGQKSLEEAGMRLLKLPQAPEGYFLSLPYRDEGWHNSWNFFFNDQ